MEENSILKQQVEVANEKLVNKVRELELAEKELAIKDKLIEIEQRRATIFEQAFEKEKELTDRALKLAEQSEKKSRWQTLGTIGVVLAVIIVAIL